ncbi:hypothetical protein J437_LFUL007545 [Ladona fulva]|uniref:Uncharacterized protein n=1 Tax=Ladona fulva TaxID=123851 RepID=A0A8K0K3Q2_LADFU|nr:hypothetical protein J437_LFUL007545 [Ladona fulva]
MVMCQGKLQRKRKILTNTIWEFLELRIGDENNNTRMNSRSGLATIGEKWHWIFENKQRSTMETGKILAAVPEFELDLDSNPRLRRDWCLKPAP